MGDRHRPFRILAQRQAWHPEYCGFLLDAAAVGQHDAGVGREVQKIQVALRFHQQDARRLALGQQSEPRNVRPRARVHGKHQRQVASNSKQRAEQRAEHLHRIHCRGTMQRHHPIAAWLQHPVGDQFAQRWPRQRRGTMLQQRIDHHVADHHDAPGRHAFRREIAIRAFFGCEQQIGNRIREHAVDLFGHRAIETAQPRLNVDHPDAEFRRIQRAGDRRIHIADHQDRVRPLRFEHALERFDDAGGLLAVAARADLEIDVRLRQPQIAKKQRRHLRTVVLPGVHEHLRDAGALTGDGRHDGSDLHEVRACADDVQNFSRGGHGGPEVGEARKYSSGIITST